MDVHLPSYQLHITSNSTHKSSLKTSIYTSYITEIVTKSLPQISQASFASFPSLFYLPSCGTAQHPGKSAAAAAPLSFEQLSEKPGGEVMNNKDVADIQPASLLVPNRLFNSSNRNTGGVATETCFSQRLCHVSAACQPSSLMS